MKHIIVLLFFTCLICTGQNRLANRIFETDVEPNRVFYEEVITDYKNFYSKDTIDNSLFWVTACAIIANTNIDHNFNHWYNDNVRSDRTNLFSRDVKAFGDGSETIPILLGATLIGYGFEYYGIDTPVYEWSTKSIRSMLVGVPPLLLGQRLTGGGRHVDGDDSKWEPFNDTNGISGQAFMGAVPFITAAQMTDDILLKTALYAGSTLCAWSGVNDDDHYLSQAILGWSLAYVSTLAVFDKQAPIQLAPIIDGKRVGIGFSIKF